MNYEKCKYPKCDGSIIPHRSKFFCGKHQEMAEFTTWLLDAMRIGEEKVETKTDEKVS